MVTLVVQYVFGTSMTSHNLDNFEFYGFSAGKLKDSFWVKNEAFFNNLAEDSDICISLTTAFGGALERALLISGVIPLISL